MRDAARTSRHDGGCHPAGAKCHRRFTHSTSYLPPVPRLLPLDVRPSGSPLSPTMRDAQGLGVQGFRFFCRDAHVEEPVYERGNPKPWRPILWENPEQGRSTTVMRLRRGCDHIECCLIALGFAGHSLFVCYGLAVSSIWGPFMKNIYLCSLCIIEYMSIFYGIIINRIERESLIQWNVLTQVYRNAGIYRIVFFLTNLKTVFLYLFRRAAMMTGQIR